MCIRSVYAIAREKKMKSILTLTVLFALSQALWAQEHHTIFSKRGDNSLKSGIPVFSENSNPDAIIFENAKNNRVQDASNTKDKKQSETLFSGVDKDTLTYYQIGKASWYGKRFHGKKTASGNKFDMYQFTGAHRTLPFGTRVLVRNLKNGKEATVVINDRGPYIQSRIIDLSYAAAIALGYAENGVANVGLIVIDSLPKKASGQKNKQVRLDLMNPDNVSTPKEQSLDDPFLQWEKKGKPEVQGNERSAKFLKEEKMDNKDSLNFNFSDTEKKDTDTNQLNELRSQNPRKGSITVQVGSFKVRDNAERLKIELENKYRQPVYIKKSSSWYKVWVGQFENRSEAKVLQRRLHKNGVKSILKKI